MIYINSQFPVNSNNGHATVGDNIDPVNKCNMDKDEVHSQIEASVNRCQSGDSSSTASRVPSTDDSDSSQSTVDYNDGCTDEEEVENGEVQDILPGKRVNNGKGEAAAKNKPAVDNGEYCNNGETSTEDDQQVIIIDEDDAEEEEGEGEEEAAEANNSADSSSDGCSESDDSCVSAQSCFSCDLDSDYDDDDLAQDELEIKQFDDFLTDKQIGLWF